MAAEVKVEVEAEVKGRDRDTGSRTTDVKGRGRVWSAGRDRCEHRGRGATSGG